MRWEDIPLFPLACYEIDLGWQFLEKHIAAEQKQGLDLDPDFQRTHVWTDAQRRAYLEYSFQGGEVGRNLICATTGWRATPTPNYTLLDGKQQPKTESSSRKNRRTDSRRKFSEFTGQARFLQFRFKWRVVECRSRADILRTYLNINAGGTPHSKRELDKVLALLEKEHRP